LKHYNEALEIHKEIGNREGEASDLGNMGLVYRKQGDLEDALKHHKEALEIHKEIGDREGEASDLGNMGAVYYTQGEYKNAIKCSVISYNIFEQIGSSNKDIIGDNIKEIKERIGEEQFKKYLKEIIKK
jgi:tetratricopeptide (TPR) repeat protein